LSIETIALNCFVFDKIAFLCRVLATDRQTDRQTDGQHHRIKRFDSSNLITGSYYVQNGYIRLCVINTQKNKNKIVIIYGPANV